MTHPQGLIFDPTTGQYFMPSQPQPTPAPQQMMPQQFAQPMALPTQQFVPPMQYAQPMPAPQVAADRSFTGLYSQQTGGGPFWKFKERPLGTAYEGIVSRPLTKNDVDVQQFEGKVQTQRDGTAKVQLNVPMLMDPSHEFPDGIARLGIRGDMLGKLPAAMAAVGAPKDPESDAYVPEAGAYIRVELTNLQRVPGVAQPRQVYRVDYRRPDDPHTVAVRQRIEAAHAALASGQLQIQQPQPHGYYPGYQQGQWQQGYPQQGLQGYPPPGPHNPQQGYVAPGMPQGAPNGYGQPAPAVAPPTPAMQSAPGQQASAVTPPAGQPMTQTGSPAVPTPVPGQPVPGTPPAASDQHVSGAPAAAPGGGMPVTQIDPAAWAALSDDQKQAWLKVTGQQPPAAQ